MSISSADEYEPAAGPPDAGTSAESAALVADPELFDLLLDPLLRDEDDVDWDDPDGCCWKIPSTRLLSVQLPIRCRLKFSGCCSRHQMSWLMTPAANMTSRADTDLPLPPLPEDDDDVRPSWPADLRLGAAES